ncbi:SAPS-domain-containing protein [Agrocybe pediades]|nr:SAPS-domain-containing protein [Agrocybe pediades]
MAIADKAPRVPQQQNGYGALPSARIKIVTAKYRFGFQNASAIDSLLDKEDVVLEAILDEDDLLQECKAQNTRLIDYFERVDVLHKLFGYVTGQIEGEERGRFKYPYIATEVLCSEIWSIVNTCINEQKELLVPFWETVLDRSPEDMKTQMTMASHFAKINSVFMTKRPAEMLAFIQSQPNIVERMMRHIETPSFVDLMGRIIQLDETLPNCNVLAWLSSENLMGRLVDFLSPYYAPSIHTIVAELIKNIIAMATPSPAVGLTEGLQNGPASNMFAREIVRAENITKMVDFILNPFSPDMEESSGTDEGTLSSPTFESSISSVVQSIAVLIELIRKNNSDYLEPYLFHALRNRLIQVQQQQQTHMTGDELRASLEAYLGEMVERMGVVHLGPLLQILSSRLGEFQKYFKSPRSMHGSISTTIGRMVPFTLERYRIVELYAELLHCSNMSLLNRSPAFAHVYDSEGRLQGGLAGLEELAQVIALNGNNENENDIMDDANEDEQSEELAFPVRNPHEDSSILDSDDDDDMSTGDEPGSSDDEAMEEIAMFDEPPLSPIPFREPSLVLDSNAGGVTASPENTALSESPVQFDSRLLSADTNMNTNTNSNTGGMVVGSSPDTDHSGMTSRSSTSGRGSRRRSRSRRRTTMDSTVDTYIPVGELLKKRWLEENVVGTMIDMFFDFPWNNFLHSSVYDVIHQIMTGSTQSGYNRELIISLFRDAKILHRIVEGQKRNDMECAKPKGVRLGYMGHLMLISEDVITAMARFPPDLRLIIIQYAPEPEWDEYVTGRYNETKKEDSRLLGGGKPVVGASSGGGAGVGGGGGRAVTQWKVDENELGEEGGGGGGDAPVSGGVIGGTAGAGQSSVEGGSGGVKGEFKRSTGGGRPVSTADFGPASVPENEDGDFDDEDNVSTGRAPHFARYLAQEMASSDQFGSSDEDDDEDDNAGWLTQSTTFGASPGTPAIATSREFWSRSPFGGGSNGGSGFGDTFEPSSSSRGSATGAEDPFNPHDDDDFGPFSDSASVSTGNRHTSSSGGGAPTNTTVNNASSRHGDGFGFPASFSDGEGEDSSFESFGDFGDFQSAEVDVDTEMMMEEFGDDLASSGSGTAGTGSWTALSKDGMEEGEGAASKSEEKGKEKGK